MNVDEYNLEAYKAIRVEIDKRIEYHYKMSMWKIAIAGALITFLIEKGHTLAVPPFFITAVFLMLMDVIILENLSYIRSSGSFVKQVIEGAEADHKIIRWESDFAQLDDRWRCWSASSYIFGVWIFAPLLLIAGFVSNFQPADKTHIAILVIACYLVAYTLFLIHKTFNQPNPSFSVNTGSVFTDNNERK